MKKTFFSVLVMSLLFAGCDAHGADVAAGVGNTPGGDVMKTTGTTTAPAVVKSDAEWKKLLTPDQFSVLRQKGTEAPFTGKYDAFFEAGTYSCAACGEELFTSETKFDSGCGWPAFYAAKAGDKVKLVRDITFGMVRVEVLCANCGGHLGHVFDDAPKTPTGQRFCINSVSLKFTPAAKKEAGNPPATTQTAARPAADRPSTPSPTPAPTQSQRPVPAAGK